MFDAARKYLFFLPINQYVFKLSKQKGAFAQLAVLVNFIYFFKKLLKTLVIFYSSNETEGENFQIFKFLCFSTLKLAVDSRSIFVP